MIPTKEKDADLEEPPEIQRNVRLNWKQWMGLAVLLTVPVLALCRFLGDQKTIMEARADGLVLRAETPASARHGNVLQLRLLISAPALPDARRVNVEIASEYLKRFRGIRAQPEIVRSTDEASMIVQEMPGGGSPAPVVIELTPAEAGWARGHVRVSTESGQSVELSFKTFIFP